MISDAKLQLILTLYKNDKLTFEEARTLIQEDIKEEKFIDPFQPINPWQNPNPWINPIVTFRQPYYTVITDHINIGDVKYVPSSFTTSGGN